MVTRRPDAAFSLLEIILVILIISIIAVIAVPNFRNTYTKLQVKQTAYDLAALMRYAQSRAVTQNRLVRLQFDENHSGYWLAEQLEESTAGQEPSPFVRISGFFGRRFVIADDIKVTSDVSAVEFYPDGQIEKKRIILCHQKKCFLISSEEQRGRVHVYEMEN